MEPEAGWKALQSHLKAARAARDAGALVQAREHVDAALTIDPNFIAAQVLRESLAGPHQAGSSQTVEPEPSTLVSVSSDEPAEPELWINQSPMPVSGASSPMPASHMGGLEERVRRRRIDRCLDAARSAIVERRVTDAAAALDEVAELAPDTPALSALAAELAAVYGDTRPAALDEMAELAPSGPALGAEFAALRGDTRRPRRGAWIVAAAVLVAALLAAWPRLPKPALLIAGRTGGSAPLVSPPQPALNPEPAAAAPAAIATIATGAAIEPGTTTPVDGTTPAADRPAFSETTPRADAEASAVSHPAAIPPRPEVRLTARDDPSAAAADRRPPLPPLPDSVAITLATAAAAAPPPSAVAPPSPAAVPPPSAVAPPSPAAVPPPSVAAPPSSAAVPPVPLAAVPPRPAAASLPPAEPPAVAAAAPVPMADDSSLIRETLERYRRAYNGLDARLAHAVYPGVDLTALEHAFGDLRSQSLQFDVCNFEVHGASARATCRGSARYVPKIGSREPRAERRVWTFRLDKEERDWKIASAWAER